MTTRPPAPMVSERTVREAAKRIEAHYRGWKMPTGRWIEKDAFILARAYLSAAPSAPAPADVPDMRKFAQQVLDISKSGEDYSYSLEVIALARAYLAALAAPASETMTEQVKP